MITRSPAAASPLWDMFLQRLASSGSSLPEETHRLLATAANQRVRAAWARRTDIPQDLLIEQIETNPDRVVRWVLSSSSSRSPEELELLTTLDDPVALYGAAWNDKCPDHAAAAALLRLRASHASYLKGQLFRRRIKTDRPETRKVVVRLTPLNFQTVSDIWDMARGVPESEHVFAGRLRGLHPEAGTTAQVLAILARRSLPSRSSPVRSAIRRNMRQVLQDDLHRLLAAWADPEHIDVVAATYQELLIAASSQDTGVVAATMEQAKERHFPHELLLRLLQNPLVDDAHRAYLLSHARPELVAAWAGDYTYTVELAAVACKRIGEVGTHHSAMPAIWRIFEKNWSEQERCRLIKELVPDHARSIVSDKTCSLEVAMHARDCETVLLHYHRPEELYSRLAKELTDTQFELFIGLALEFAESPMVLIDTVRAVSKETSGGTLPTLDDKNSRTAEAIHVAYKADG